MVAITRNEAKFYIQETLKELINGLKKISVSPTSMNENGCGIMAGLENAEKTLPRLDKEYLSGLSDADLQAFLDKCKRIAWNFNLEHQRTIQPFAILDGSSIMEIKACHKDYEKETYSLTLYGGMQQVTFEYSIEPGFWNWTKERYVSWTLWENKGGFWKQFEHDYLKRDLPQIFDRSCMLIFREPGLYKITAELLQYNKGRKAPLPTGVEILCHKEIDVNVKPCNCNKNDFSIVITRSCLETEYNDNPVFPMYYKSVLELKYKDFVCFSCPVQSVADNKNMNTHDNDKTLKTGDYIGYLKRHSVSYKTPIHLINKDLGATNNDAFLIHPDRFTRKPGGPWKSPGSKGCQILKINDFNDLLKCLYSYGFESNDTDFIRVKIK